MSERKQIIHQLADSTLSADQRRALIARYDALEASSSISPEQLSAKDEMKLLSARMNDPATGENERRELARRYDVLDSSLNSPETGPRP